MQAPLPPVTVTVARSETGRAVVSEDLSIWKYTNMRIDARRFGDCAGQAEPSP